MSRLLTSVFFLACLPCFSENIKLEWNASKTEGAAYRLYVHTSSRYSFTESGTKPASGNIPESKLFVVSTNESWASNAAVVAVVETTNASATLTNDGRYFFAVAAVKDGIESELSNEVQFNEIHAMVNIFLNQKTGSNVIALTNFLYVANLSFASNAMLFANISNALPNSELYLSISAGKNFVK